LLGNDNLAARPIRHQQRISAAANESRFAFNDCTGLAVYAEPVAGRDRYNRCSLAICWEGMLRVTGQKRLLFFLTVFAINRKLFFRDTILWKGESEVILTPDWTPG
jgi:hypothetical protein